jgi:hypothetical protein
MTGDFRLCLLGLPKTGKTTYLAALWSYLRSELTEGMLRIIQLPEDTGYLDEISYAWAAGDPMPRSSPGVSDHIEFTIEVPDRPPLQVVLPDLPGEVFLNAVRRPAIDEGPGTAVLDSDLLLLFVNCRSATMFEPLGDHPADPAAAEPPPPANGRGAGPPVITTHQSMGESRSGDDLVAAGQTVPDVPTLREFDIGALDTDTLNCELLERLENLVIDNGFPPLLVVVSAWDVYAAEAELTPYDWLRDHQPMLWQHIEELGRTKTVGVVGVSAQGADYQDQPDIVEADVGARAWGTDSSGGHTDIAGPLLWYHALLSPDG